MVALSRAEDLWVSRHGDGKQSAAVGAAEQYKYKDMRTAFRAFDINNDGFIDASELRSTMANLTGDALSDADIEAMVRSADKNDDGRIDYEG